MNQPQDLQSYINDAGELCFGTAEEVKRIKQVRKRKYQREYKRKRRGMYKEITVTLTPEEKANLSTIAKSYTLTLPQFLRQATLSYLKQTYLVPNPDQIAHIEQLLSLWHTDTQRLIRLAQNQNEENLVYAFKLMQQRITTLEQELSKLLREPKLLAPSPPAHHDHQNPEPENG